MLEIFGDIWKIWDTGYYDAIVITTNGYIKQDGRAVMGRGIAKEARDKFPNLDARLGSKLKIYGNHVFMFSPDEFLNPVLFTFPVKPEFGSRGEPGWKVKADMNLVKQ